MKAKDFTAIWCMQEAFNSLKLYLSGTFTVLFNQIPQPLVAGVDALYVTSNGNEILLEHVIAK